MKNRAYKYGLEKNDLKEIIYVIEDNENVEEAILFGSRAKGNFKAASDIDIALVGKNLKLNDILEISIHMDDLYLPYKFDFVNYYHIKEEKLIEHINRIGIRLFKKEKEYH
ncbi:nucleotidyltransferase domain-containing protein [Autumnicola edwardsiae]|uniref:Nucleotidyltransferase domain-containing protein n=1 Tax=Autumnicola edwardsiae TaxID=3075594 RepID=A0ABU3CWJ2_9FLAO|nr:nucleotidyltransferase domain-containing protein [Zunongwangia sp. F297]MDT0650732.1 nucleotidyltransferase domain-containing protein [Zunongwangia sp. F297]